MGFKIAKHFSLLIMKVEYVDNTKATKEMIWLQRFMDGLGKKQEMGRLYNDN